MPALLCCKLQIISFSLCNAVCAGVTLREDNHTTVLVNWPVYVHMQETAAQERCGLLRFRSCGNITQHAEIGMQTSWHSLRVTVRYSASFILCVNACAGVTLRENNLKELDGGRILDSQGVLVVNRRALQERLGLMEVSIPR